MFETSLSLSQPEQTNHVSLLQQHLAMSNKQSAALLQVQMEASQSNREAIMRRQLEAMLMHAERSLANEESSRALSSTFNNFSLLQKIMQTMG